MFYPQSFSLVSNLKILEEEALVLTQHDLTWILIDFKRHKNNMKKNQEETEMIRFSKWAKQHLE